MVEADPSLRYTGVLLGREASNQPSNKPPPAVSGKSLLPSPPAGCQTRVSSSVTGRGEAMPDVHSVAGRAVPSLTISSVA